MHVSLPCMWRLKWLADLILLFCFLALVSRQISHTMLLDQGQTFNYGQYRDIPYMVE